jgi:outer membrane autotransporter protein
MDKKEKYGRITALALLFSGAAMAGTASAEITPATVTKYGYTFSISVEGDTVTFDKVAVNGSLTPGELNNISGIDVKKFDEPDKNLIINFEGFPGNGEGYIGNGLSPVFNTPRINAKSLTINAASTGNLDWRGKGMCIENNLVTSSHITAENITINSYYNGLYSNPYPSSELNGFTIDGFKSLTIVNSADHAAIANNRTSHMTLSGEADSVVDIKVVNNSSEKKRAAIEDCSTADAGGTSITAGTIRVTTPNRYVLSNAYRTSLGGAATPGKIDLEGSNEVVLTTTYEGGYAIANLNNMADSSVKINKTARGRVDITGNIDASHGLADIDFAGADSRLAGSVTTAGETGKAVLNFIGDNSTMTGSVTAADSSTITETMSGTNAAMTGDITAEDSSTVTAAFSGANTSMTGNIATEGSSTVTAAFSGENSSLTGNITTTGGTMTAQFTGSGSTWTGDLETSSGTSNIVLTSSAVWNGNLNAAGGTTTVALSDSSTWNGAAVTDSGAESTVDITSGSTWNVTDNSSVTNLILASGGTIAMEGTTNRLSIENFTAPEAVSGTLLMDLVYHDNNLSTYQNASDSDFLYVTSGIGATLLIEPTSSSTLNTMSEGDRLYFAQTGIDSTAFKVNQEVLVMNSSKLYDKDLIVKNDQNTSLEGYEDWYLTTSDSYTNGDRMNPNGLVPTSAYTAALAIWRDSDTLLKRLGELRYNQEDQGTWVRYSRRKLEKDNTHTFSSKLNALQVGYDTKRTEEKGDWYYGAAIEHVWGDTDYDYGFGYGSGDSKMTDLTLYGTNIRSKGQYLDLTARVGRVDTDYDVSYGDGGDSGDFDNWAFSIGAEYGRKSGLGSGWYWEWQTQLTYSYVWGDNYTTANGAQISQDNFDSLVGRLGLVLSREFGTDTAKPGRVYVKASLLHEFLGDSSERLYDDVFFYDSEDLDDTWYTVGLGANVKLSGNCDLYLDAERDFDADIENKYRFECGLRFEF